MAEESCRKFQTREYPVSRIAVTVSIHLPPEQELSIAAYRRAGEKAGFRDRVVVQEVEGGDSAIFVAGRKALLAHQTSGRATIPCTVYQGSIPEPVAPLVEAYSFEKKDWISVAFFMADLKFRFGYQNVETAQLLGVAESTVCGILPIANISPEVAQAWRNERARGKALDKEQLAAIAKLTQEEQMGEYQARVTTPSTLVTPEDDIRKSVETACSLLRRLSQVLHDIMTKVIATQTPVGLQKLFASILVVHEDVFTLKMFIRPNSLKLKVVRWLFG